MQSRTSPSLETNPSLWCKEQTNQQRKQCVQWSSDLPSSSTASTVAPRLSSACTTVARPLRAARWRGLRVEKPGRGVQVLWRLDAVKGGRTAGQTEGELDARTADTLEEKSMFVLRCWHWVVGGWKQKKKTTSKQKNTRGNGENYPFGLNSIILTSSCFHYPFRSKWWKLAYGQWKTGRTYISLKKTNNT